MAEASQIYATDVEREMRARAQVFRDTWEGREPQAVAAFFHGFEQTLCYLTVHFPRAYVSLIRTTNLLERFHKEIRRKQRDIGMLHSAAGGDVLWYMVVIRETAKQRASCRGKGWEFAKKVIHYPLAAAMAEPHLNNVMTQYFAGRPPTTTFTPSQKLPGPAPHTMSQGDVEQLVSTLFTQNQLRGFDFSATVFNFLLPQGTILNDDPAPGASHRRTEAEVRRRGVPHEEESNSLNGLDGYHGSVQINGTTVYYAVGVYSETNGIPVFEAPWKNVVATFYHELNEARTDPDVERVISGGRASLLGWTSRQGEECGDFPVFEANSLTLVFQEVPLVTGGTAPIQLQYSNFVHGPEGPVATPDPASTHRGQHRV